MSEYVRNQCDEARIEIELQGDSTQEKYTVTRCFNLENKNVWYINNKKTSESEIKKLVKQLSIQVNNLCQFLPQDRVQDFAKMDKKELLRNMQIAVGREDLVDKQDELIKLQQEQEQIKKELESLHKKLDQAEKDNARLESKVKNFKERKKCLEEIEHIKRKLGWKKYDKSIATVEEVQKDLLKAGKILMILSCPEIIEFIHKKN